MQKLRMFAIGVLCLSLLTATLGCRTPAGRSPGQVIDDSTITTKIKGGLIQDPYLSVFTISVKTFEGTVTLMGAVDSQFSKDRASALAQTVDGVVQVNNHIVVRQ
jgi:hyperosmotically inducible protein